MVIFFCLGNFGLGGVSRIVTLVGESLGKDNEVYYYPIENVAPFWSVKKRDHILCHAKDNNFFIFFKKVYKHLAALGGQQYNINFVQSNFIRDLSK